MIILEKEKRPEKIPHSLLKFAGASIGGAGLAGITLIPGIVAVSRTPAAAEAGTGLQGVYGDIWKQLGALMGRFHVFCKIRGAGRCKPLLRMCGASFCRNLFPEQRDPQDRKDHVRGNGSSVFCRLSYHSAESVVSRNAQTGGDSQSFCVYSHLSAFENKL